MSISRDRPNKSIMLTQQSYVAELYERFNLAPPSSFPLTPMVETSSTSSDALLADDITLYQAKVGVSAIRGYPYSS
jgi:hypothetical protein